MQDLFLHNYDLSPFSRKSFKMLALKKLAWHSVEMPMIAPKPDLTPLTGGYRGTPVLQIGADVYVDTARIRQVPSWGTARPGGYTCLGCSELYAQRHAGD